MKTGSGYRFDRFVLNLDRGSLQEDGRDLDLRPKAFDVLRQLVENAGRLVSKDDLVRAVWPNVIVNDDALAQCVRDIRKVLRDEGERFIKTVPRRGYMFVAETSPIGDRVSTTANNVPLPTSSWGRYRIAIATGASFALVLLALAAWGSGWFAQTPVRDTRLAVAVLPFANVSENPGEDWLGEGIAEDIMTAVARFRDLTVIARNSSFRFRGEKVDVQKTGQALNADFLLQGTVRRSGDQLRITAQLVDARTDATRWAEKYDRLFADVFAIQDEIADEVAAQLVVHAREVAATRVRNRAPEHLEAYELAIRGRKAYRTFTRDGAVEARALAERAIAIDPNFAAAWEVLAAALIQFYVQPYGPDQGTPAMLQHARAAAEKAVSLDANFATGQAMLAFALMWAKEHDASLDALRKAISLNPSDAVAHAIYGNVLTFVGSYRESIESWDRSERIDPFFPALNLALKAIPYVMLGEFEQALRLSRSCAQRAPKLQACFLWLAVAANELGHGDEARGAVRRILEINPKFTVRQWMRLVPWRDAAAFERHTEYLRRTGLPE